MTLERRLSVAVCCGYDFRGHALNRRNCARPPRRPRGRPEAAPHPLPAAPRPESGRVGGSGGLGVGAAQAPRTAQRRISPPGNLRGPCGDGDPRKGAVRRATARPRVSPWPGVSLPPGRGTQRSRRRTEAATVREPGSPARPGTGLPPRLAGAAPRAPRAPLASASAAGADLAGPAGGLGPDPFLLLVLKSYSISFLSF